MSFAIRVENLGKRYRLGLTHAGSIREMVNRTVGRLLGRQQAPLPHEISKLTGGRQDLEPDGGFWALRDVSFEVRPGEVVGIIGRNGSGKSTLLKVLSEITAPTSGRVTLHGRVASLLEVGTGFHHELSGRENVYLNGAILGMSRAEVRRKFEEIVAFAEVEKFIDTPVKRYSSGMYVRLAFAVAAYLETDVLLVDEVLAVGDASFQSKSLGKMSDVAKGGRTVLFVSHNLGAVRNLCSRSLLFDAGTLKFNGATAQALAIYERRFRDLGGKLAASDFSGPLADRLIFQEVSCVQDGGPVAMVDPMHDFTIELRGEARRAFQALDLNIALYRDGFHITSWFDTPAIAPMREGNFVSRFCVPGGVLRSGRYTICIGASTSGEWILGADVATIDCSENLGGRPKHRMVGSVHLPHTAVRKQ